MRKEADRYVGRGVYDMKCAIAAYMKVVDELQDRLANYDFNIMLTSDEEMSGGLVANGTREFVKEGYLPEVVCLPDGGREWQLEASAKGVMNFLLEAHGKASHGSRPWLGENAIYKLMDALQDLRQRFQDQTPDTDTLNIGVIQGGEIFNKVPHYAMAELDIRLEDAGSRQRRTAMIEELCRKHDLTATLKIELDPLHNDLNNFYVRGFTEIVERVVGVKAEGVKSYGGSDARFFAYKGIPYINFYPFGGGHHADDEWIEARSLQQLPQVFRQYLDRVAKRP
jgi:succinyl-diaminopimelate desuccinylase